MAGSADARLEYNDEVERRIEISEEKLCPMEPRLLDTSVLQNFDWVDRRVELTGPISWDQSQVAALTNKYGAELANDNLGLGILYKQFANRPGSPWLVSRVSVAEMSVAGRAKGVSFSSMLGFLHGHQDDWPDATCPGVAKRLLFAP